MARSRAGGVSVQGADETDHVLLIDGHGRDGHGGGAGGGGPCGDDAGGVPVDWTARGLRTSPATTPVLTTPEVRAARAGVPAAGRSPGTASVRGGTPAGGRPCRVAGKSAVIPGHSGRWYRYRGCVCVRPPQPEFQFRQDVHRYHGAAKVPRKWGSIPQRCPGLVHRVAWPPSAAAHCFRSLGERRGHGGWWGWVVGSLKNPACWWGAVPSGRIWPAGACFRRCLAFGRSLRRAEGEKGRCGAIFREGRGRWREGKSENGRGAVLRAFWAPGWLFGRVKGAKGGCGAL